MNWTTFWDILDKIGIFAAVASIFVSLSIRAYLWRKEKRDNALIDIRLHCPNPETLITLQGQIRRKNLTRAEVQGLLGILPMKEKGKRYELQALNQKAFFDALEEAQVNAEIHELVIECSAKELEQFDLGSQADN
ncbi:hypothetical protein [uncultured Thiothrix sp.]|uniref:hypothetical protein n=1 Tax=uncultured Thiothrix sp. TaxID=223185 RepID=UPI002606D346|nr:hypothetical protein [uncultured Thiothrix sp.]